MILAFSCTNGIETMNADEIVNFYTAENKENIKVYFKGGHHTYLCFENTGQSSMALEKLRDAVQKNTQTHKGTSMIKEAVSDAREFIKEHRGVIYTVALVMLIDHFVFGGVFRERAKALLEKLLCKAEKKINEQ